MKIVTSPAKLMNISHQSNLLKCTTPIFINEANEIHKHLKNKSPKFLSELMDISPKLADENWERNQKWKPKPKRDESNQAIFAFTGEVYRGLDAKTLDKNALNYLQKNFRILSGLYGLLKPSDSVMLYRLEMGRKFEFDHYKNLYDFWKEKITQQINKELGKREILLNLASKEYFSVIDRKKINSKIIDFEFYELKTGTPKNITVFTKHARGLVVRFCAQNNLKNLEDVKSFNLERYIISEELSTDHKLVFVR